MTIQEALNEITAQPKWYAVTLNMESTYRVMALRILKGTAKPGTIRKFFETFGYEVKTDVRVHKRN